jgi:hypothetical protein
VRIPGEAHFATVVTVVAAAWKDLVRFEGGGTGGMTGRRRRMGGRGRRASV